ncbi:MAG: hypothetical protein ABLT11_07065 [Candidatus Acidiferrum sp.]
MDDTFGFCWLPKSDDEKDGLRESIKQQIPHPLKKRGFGMTGFGSLFITWRDQVRNREEIGEACAKDGTDATYEFG